MNFEKNLSPKNSDGGKKIIDSLLESVIALKGTESLKHYHEYMKEALSALDYWKIKNKESLSFFFKATEQKYQSSKELSMVPINNKLISRVRKSLALLVTKKEIDWREAAGLTGNKVVFNNLKEATSLENAPITDGALSLSEINHIFNEYDKSLDKSIDSKKVSSEAFKKLPPLPWLNMMNYSFAKDFDDMEYYDLSHGLYVAIKIPSDIIDSLPIIE